MKSVIAIVFGWMICVSPVLADGPAKKVLVIGIDGCRPDAIAAANTPNLKKLIERHLLRRFADSRPP